MCQGLVHKERRLCNKNSVWLNLYKKKACLWRLWQIPGLLVLSVKACLFVWFIAAFIICTHVWVNTMVRRYFNTNSFLLLSQNLEKIYDTIFKHILENLKSKINMMVSNRIYTYSFHINCDSVVGVFLLY